MDKNLPVFFLNEVNASERSVTLKQGIGRLGRLGRLVARYDHAKFERHPLNRVREKAHVKVFVKSQSMLTN